MCMDCLVTPGWAEQSLWSSMYFPAFWRGILMASIFSMKSLSHSIMTSEKKADFHGEL